MSTIDLRKFLIGQAQRLSDSLMVNLKAIHEEKRNVSPGGIARSPIYMVAECAAVNGMLGDFLAGREVAIPAAEEREAFYRSFTTAEKAMALLEKNTTSVMEAVAHLSEEALAEVIPTPFGREMSRFDFAELIMGHMNYHIGQLNYIQTLYGDAESHR